MVGLGEGPLANMLIARRPRVPYNVLEKGEVS